jgi:hypothetical protein
MVSVSEVGIFNCLSYDFEPVCVFDRDEPTSGLDARAAAIVMRTVRNTVNTGDPSSKGLQFCSIQVVPAALCASEKILPLHLSSNVNLQCVPTLPTDIPAPPWELKRYQCICFLVDAGRTVVCTIHQPSIDIFEAFDELLLMKRGGYVIYFGPLGERSQQMVDYFQV